jgi:hypothetical protein
MTKLKVNEGEVAAPASPSETMIQDALKAAVLTDERGRKISVRKPDPLAQFRLIKAVGPEYAANDTYMRMINPLIWIADIDDVPVLPPASDREVEALIVRLGDDGLATVMAWYVVNVIQPTVDAINAAEKAAQLKN